MDMELRDVIMHLCSTSSLKQFEDATMFFNVSYACMLIWKVDFCRLGYVTYYYAWSHEIILSA